MYSKKLDESEFMKSNTVMAVIRTLYEKSEAERRHSEKVGDLCEKIGIALKS